MSQASLHNTAPPPLEGPDPGPEEALAAVAEQANSADLSVKLTSEFGRLWLTLPSPDETALELSEIWQQVRQRLNAGARFWQPQAQVELVVGKRLLDARQLQSLAEVLAAAQLQLKRIHTSRRQTAVAAATAGYSVEQELTPESVFAAPRCALSLADPLYLETTLRSGVEIRHPGSVFILGDLNPGSAIIAEGDILVWGRLRGIAHAGSSGNPHCRIMALQMEATQLRIADQVARAPKPLAETYPEVAYIAPDGIQLSRATEFPRHPLRPDKGVN